MSDDEYEVGYGKPPKNTQFKKGKSGNPRGRPPKDKNPKVWNIDDLRLKVLAIGNHPVNVTIDGEQLPMPTILAIYTQLYKKALTGNMQAIKEIIKLIPILFKEEEAQQIKFWEMIANAKEAEEEKYSNMSFLDVELERYQHFKRRRSYRKLMGEEKAPFELEEPVDDRDWKAYEKYLEDIKTGRPGQWPPAYWDEEDPNQHPLPEQK